MDGKPKSKESWAFMAEHMPRCVAYIKRARSKGEGAHIDLCWRRGVVEMQPGWFWCYEGGVSVGVPDLKMLSDPNMTDVLQRFPALNLVMLKDKAAVT